MAKKEDTPTPVLGESSKSQREAGDPKIIDDRYKIVGLLGQGGMGKVFLAVDTLLNRKVAIKVLPFDTAADELYVRFHREARAASKLSHPGIITTLDFGVTEDGKPYLVMEYLEGATLDQYLAEHGTLDFDAFSELIAGVAAAMANAHQQGVIHRDLKPANIIIGSGELESRVMILDFGIAKIIHDSKTQFDTKTGQMIGSPKYISPEQIEGRLVDERSDIYSLGCVMYEALTGEAPYRGENVLDTLDKHLNEPVPNIVDKVDDSKIARFGPLVSKAMAKDPAERFQSMEELLNAIAETSEVALSEDMEEGKENFDLDTTFDPGKKGKGSAGLVVVSTTILMLIALFYFGLSFTSDSASNSSQGVERSDDGSNSLLKELGKTPEITLNSIYAQDNHTRFVTYPDHELASLEKLHLQNTGVCDEDLERLSKCKNLRELNLSGTQVSSASIDYIVEIEKLNSLHLERTNFLDHSKLDKLKELPRLFLLDIGSNNLKNIELKSVAELKNLNYLDIDSNPSITDEGLRYLAPLKYLKVLNLSGTNITPGGLKFFKNRNVTIVVESIPVFENIDLENLSERLNCLITRNVSAAKNDELKLILDAR